MEFAIWDQFHRLPHFPEQREAHVLYLEHYFKQVEVAEALGYSHYYIIEHQSNFVGTTSPTVIIAALSQRTKTIRLGSMVWQLPFHNPMRLAQEIALLDQLTYGRIEFGTGLGVHEHEYIRFGIDFENRREIAEEVLEVILKAWTQTEVTHDGKFFHYDDCYPFPQPYQLPHPPIWVAVHSKRAIEFAARKGLAIASNIDGDTVISEKYHYFEDVFRQTHGDAPMPKKWLMRAVIVDETDAKAMETAEKYLPNMFDNGLGDFLRGTRIGSGPSKWLTGPEDNEDNAIRRALFKKVRESWEYALEEGLAIVGSPDTVAERIEKQAALMGGLDVYCAEFDLRMPTPLVERSVDLFGRHVIPAFRG